MNNGDGKKSQWMVVPPTEVPAKSELAALHFERPHEKAPEPYDTPEAPESSFKKPGPAAGPFQAHLGDGSVVTYYWYRFADQPALLNADLTKEEREQMQVKVEEDASDLDQATGSIWLRRRWANSRDWTRRRSLRRQKEWRLGMCRLPRGRSWTARRGLAGERDRGSSPSAQRSSPHLTMKRFLAFVTVLLASLAGLKAAPQPVQVFILAGQSNMEGQAVVDLDGKNYNDGKGTLAMLMRDPEKAPIFQHLRGADGKWTVRDDVWVHYQREDRPLLAGPLAIGFSVYGDQHHFGPELQFGHVMGDYFGNQVLLIKTAWGGKSLFRDFRPPPRAVRVDIHTLMIAQVRKRWPTWRRSFPATRGRGYELAGFVWYQGWNDGSSGKSAVAEYEANQVNLIHDVRAEFKTPKLPVVIGELTGPWVKAEGVWEALREAQVRGGGAARVCRQCPLRSHPRLRAQA